MTFEEFFIKKKIDLKALKAADGPLFEEFKAHYSVMGEKSFDHSKKFWFNKLRKSFHLKEEETPAAKPAVKQAVIDTPTDTSGAEATKPAGFKPRFKAAITPAVDEAKTTEAPDSAKTETDSAPTGFKPRFKAGITKAPDAASTPASEEATDETIPSAPKPTGFKPRFKAGVTKTEASEQALQAAPIEKISSETTINAEPENNNSDTQEPVANKPTGFKPRFKAGVTKTETSEQAPQAAPIEKISSETTINAEPENNNSDPQQPVANKPTGFKPRFKAGVTKTETSEQAPQAAPIEKISSETTINAEPENNNSDPQQPVANKPTGFKPRFKAGITKIDKKEE